MRATRSAALIILLSAVAADPALSQDTGFIAGQSPDLWRASRLVGVDVFGPDDKKVGEVTDVLVDHAGRAAAVVIGIGGVLGLGRKDVALPYAALHFTDAPRPNGRAAASAGALNTASGMPTEPGLTAGSAIPVESAAAQGEAPAAKGGPVGTTAGVPGGAVTGQAATPVPAGQGASGMSRGTSRPDHARIDLTFDQLKAAPSFSFAQ